ncbi:DUF4112 domain-containing protein [Algivirga pacifica]|uniref:DUF4112 domain-containing protein n=1 Tax=Algivirga pacifica TaxID=1162670 RepID=A0ABP9DLC3_9BACT
MAKITDRSTSKSSLKLLDRLAYVLDDVIRIPGTNIRIGLDPLLGLLPIAGDTLTLIISSYMLIVAAKNGASAKVLTQMAGNVLVDYVGGSIPVVGDIFDVAYRSNRRNYDLLKDYIDVHPEEQRRTKRGIILLAVGLIAGLAFVLVAVIWLVYSLLQAVLS